MDIAVINNDISIKNGIIEIDDTIKNSILISLFTDNRISDDFEIPDRTNERRGYWGDSLEDFELGSLLWTLEREKINNNLLEKIDNYTNESLKWMIDDGIVKSIETIVERDPVDTSRVNWQISVEKPDGNSEEFNFSLNWENL